MNAINKLSVNDTHPRQNPSREATNATDLHGDVIARLAAQLHEENLRIAELLDHQRQLRNELLRAQERQLASLRPTRLPTTADA